MKIKTKQNGDKYITSVFGIADYKNRNGRTYPYDVFKLSVTKLKDKVDKGNKDILVELSHPEDYIDIKKDAPNVIGYVSKIDYFDEPFEGKLGSCYATCEITLFDVPMVYKIGDNHGVSTRAGGIIANGKVVRWDLKTIDIVEVPSCQVCYINESGSIKVDINDILLEYDNTTECECNISTLSTDDMDIVRNEIINKFVKLLK